MRVFAMYVRYKSKGTSKHVPRDGVFGCEGGWESDLFTGPLASVQHYSITRLQPPRWWLRDEADTSASHIYRYRCVMYNHSKLTLSSRHPSHFIPSAPLPYSRIVAHETCNNCVTKREWLWGMIKSCTRLREGSSGWKRGLLMCRHVYRP